MSKIYKTKQFAKLAKKIGLDDEVIKVAALEILAGKYEANLGANVYKKRIAMPGQGKSSSTRHIVATNLNDKLFFMDCYKKSNKDNLLDYEEEMYKKLAKFLLSLGDKELDLAINAKKLELL